MKALVLLLALLLPNCGASRAIYIASTPDFVITKESESSYTIIARSQAEAERLAERYFNCTKRPCFIRMIGTVVDVQVPKLKEYKR